MKYQIILFTAASLLSLLACNSEAKKDENAMPAADSAAVASTPAAEEKPEVKMDSTAMAKAWEAYMTPGDMHKWMATSDGKWTGEFTSWMEPGGPPSPTSKLKVENKTIMGGRYQESVYKGDMMGMPFEGHSTMAYDNSKKKFVSTWIDNMGTGIMVMEGTYDEPSKSLRMTGKMMDPILGKDIEMREEFKMIDDKTQVMEMYCNKDGKEYKNLEIKLTRN